MIVIRNLREPIADRPGESRAIEPIENFTLDLDPGYRYGARIARRRPRTIRRNGNEIDPIQRALQGDCGACECAPERDIELTENLS